VFDAIARRRPLEYHQIVLLRFCFLASQQQRICRLVLGKPFKLAIVAGASVLFLIAHTAPVGTFRRSEQQSIAGHEPDRVIKDCDALEVGTHDRIPKREGFYDFSFPIVELIDNCFFIGYRQQPLIGRECEAGDLPESLGEFPL